MTFRHCVAVDLGASSGRVMLARYDSKHRTLTLREIHRFVNCLQKTDGFDTWDIDSLEKDIRLGLKKVCNEGILIDSIGIDTWGVDYVLLDKQGQRVGLPVSYRDNRTTGIMPQALVQIGKSEIYRRSGIQFLPFNTIYQLFFAPVHASRVSSQSSVLILTNWVVVALVYSQFISPVRR